MNSRLIRISGKVVKVGFRSYAVEHAYRLGIKGYIQYTGKDSLIIVAEGEEEKLEEFLTWCRKGPTWAKVNNLTVEEGEVKNFEGFEIHHLPHHHNKPDK